MRISDWSSDVCSFDFIEAGEPQPGLEEATPDRLHLVLDLTLLPSRRRRAGGRLDHIMVGHDQEPPVEDPLLAGEHARHRRLHIIVDAAARHPAEESKAARMRVEQHVRASSWERVCQSVENPGGAVSFKTQNE